MPLPTMPVHYSVGHMESVTATFFDLVRPDLPAVEARMRSGADLEHPSLNAAVDHLLSSGGKRIRPTLVLLTAAMLGAERDRTLTLAAAIEMLHTASLVHDDLIDKASTRRGIPTINSRWNAGATVLTGDYIFARAAQLAAKTGSLEVMDSFAGTLMTIVNGEIRQLLGDGAGASRQGYMERIYAKTASLFELATRGAGLLAQVDQRTLRDLERLGYAIGIAFQIVDDVLDFVADEQELGKPVASDLRHGLITLPTLYYLEDAGSDPVIDSILQGKRVDDGAFDRLVQAIRTSGAVDQSLAEARQVINQGIEVLASMPISAEREALRDLTEYVIQRTI